MGKIATRVGTIGVDVTGDGGTPLLFLHGVGSNRSAWTHQLARFADERRTIAMDLPGYGESAFIVGATRETIADAALAVLDALEIERAHVCGLSLGGIVALAMHGAAPERLSTLTLADTFARHPEGHAIYDRSLAAAAELGMRGLAEARVDALLAQPSDAAIRAEVIGSMARIDPAAYRNAAAAVWLADVRPAAAGVKCPTLILHGSQDRITPASLSEELKSLIGHAALVEISGAGHLSNIEQPAIFNRVLAAFLADAESA